MPNPENFVGKYINYNIDPGGTAVAQIETRVKRQNGFLTDQTKAAAVFVVDSTGPSAGANTTSWRFTFLKYISGAITTAPLSGGVMTGPFTGCFAFIYKVNGMPTLAHVGTAETPSDERTKFVKSSWKAVANVPNASADIVGNQPTTFIRDAEVYLEARKAGGQLPKLCAYFEGKQAWAILFVPAERGFHKITIVKKMLLVPWSRLAKLERFA